MSFGQLVVGPPGNLINIIIEISNIYMNTGCGKTTYCDGMSQFLRGIERPVSIINLDPANDNIP